MATTGNMYKHYWNHKHYINPTFFSIGDKIDKVQFILIVYLNEALECT